jgi:hypothetical protein
MKSGDLVDVLDWKGSTLTRRVIRTCGNLVFVCTEEEYRDANTERREPLSVGWPNESVSEKRNEQAKDRNAIHRPSSKVK